ncbi:MAG: Aminodeoxychorismate lyase [Candidatus Erwinia impunctatus]|nr:Aminodeoxychorismate lyase [Culicoides impunctatus]
MLYVNGHQAETLPITDRAVQFGDGCFTTALIRRGEIVALNAHLERLKNDSQRLGIDGVAWSPLSQEMINAARSQKLAVLKVIISRGAGGRGYHPAGCHAPTRIMMLSSYPAHYHQWRKQGISLTLSPVRLGKNPLLAGVKHLNRLEQVLVRQALEQQDADDALVLDSTGNLIECSAANIFWCQSERVFTPDVSESGVRGIQRQWVISWLAAQGREVEEVSCGIEALHNADEIFITNALMPILPVNRVDGRHYANHELFRQISQQAHNRISDEHD